MSETPGAPASRPPETLAMDSTKIQLMKIKLLKLLLCAFCLALAASNAPAENNDDMLKRASSALDRGDYELAIFTTDVALRPDPSNTVARLYRGIAFDMKGEWDKAVTDLNIALRVQTKEASGFAHRAHAYSSKSEWDRAIADASISIHLDPKRPAAYETRGYAYYKKGEHASAQKDWLEVIKLEPRNAWAFNSLAWVLATSKTDSIRNGKEAIRAAQTACELTDWKKWYCVGTLAAAYAESGDFAQALKYQKQAIDMAGPSPDERKELRRRLSLYDHKMPEHEVP